MGVHADAPHVDLAAIVAEKNALVERHRRDSFEHALSDERLVLVEGAARFRSPREVVVGDRPLRAGRIFIATGMRPRVPPVEGLDRIRYFTNEDVMDVSYAPPHLIVVGGGYVACELGQAYARFG